MVQPAHSRLKSLTGRIATYTALLIWSGVCVFPIYWFGITSIKGFNDIAKGPRYLPFVDFQPTLASWRFVFTDHQDNLRLGYMNSIIVASASTLLTLTFGAMAVYGLTRLRPTIPWSAVALLGFGLSLGAIILFERAAWPWCFAVFALASIFFIAMRGWARGPMLEPHLIAFGLIASRILPPVAMIAPLYVMAEMTGLLDTNSCSSWSMRPRTCPPPFGFCSQPSEPAPPKPKRLPTSTAPPTPASSSPYCCQ